MENKPREEAPAAATCEHVVGTLKVRGRDQHVRCGATPAKKTGEGWRCADHFPKVAG